MSRLVADRVTSHDGPEAAVGVSLLEPVLIALFPELIEERQPGIAAEERLTTG